MRYDANSRLFRISLEADLLLNEGWQVDQSRKGKDLLEFHFIWLGSLRAKLICNQMNGWVAKSIFIYWEVIFIFLSVIAVTSSNVTPLQRSASIGNPFDIYCIRSITSGWIDFTSYLICCLLFSVVGLVSQLTGLTSRYRRPAYLISAVANHLTSSFSVPLLSYQACQDIEGSLSQYELLVT